MLMTLYFLTLKKSSKETTEAITIEAITQEATRMKIGILFLLFARSLREIDTTQTGIKAFFALYVRALIRKIK